MSTSWIKFTQSDIERFEPKYERIPIAGCWIWTGAVFPRNGYGAFAHTEQLAHRMAWLLYRGAIPRRAQVLHSCDVPCCVNPEHLFIGNQADNMADKVRKDRQSRGVGTGMAKITEEQVTLIRTDQRKQAAIAAQYGISQSQVCDIKRRASWKHVP